MTLTETVRAQVPQVRADLEALVALQSVSADADRAGDVQRSA